MTSTIAAIRQWYRALKKRHSLRLSGQLLEDRELTAGQFSELRMAIGRALSKTAWYRPDSHDYRFVEEDTALLESAWTLAKDADIACRLGLMYRRTNRNQEAIGLYRDALRLHPNDARLRYQASIHALRFAEYDTLCAYLESALRDDPGDAFAQLVIEIARSFDEFVELITRQVDEDADSLPPYLVAISIWGQAYVRDFMRQACAALLADGNLPALARQYRVHIVVFTTAEGERDVRADPMYARMATVAKLHFVHFKADWLDYPSRMRRHYGEELGSDYIANCKFLLFSCAHRATLEAGRRVGGLVTPMGTDNIFNDGAFGAIGEIMKGPYDAVLVTGFRLLDSTVKPIAEAKFRRADGVLQIPEADYADLVARHIPENYFVASRHYTHFPLMACWRISESEVLVHSNHYHPVCIRPGAIGHPIRLSSDPVDGLFMHRELPDAGRMFIVRDTRVAISDWGANPLVAPPGNRGPDLNEMSLWLWMYWDSLRAPYFRTPIRIGRRGESEKWSRAEAEARDFVERILAESARRESLNERRRSWLPDGVARPPRRS